MKKDTAYINKILQKKQHERSMQYHLQNIRNVRPLTKPIQMLDININNRKKEYQNEMRFTEIQRENRILLEKISSIMNKTRTKGKWGDRDRDRGNGSLNSTYRRKQIQDIEIENARMLKRLQEKKPNYETEKLNKQWTKQKNVMRIMSNFPLIFSSRPKQKRNSSSHLQPQTPQTTPIELVRMRVLNSHNFLITLHLSSKLLRITGDCKQRKQVKVIEIQRNQAIQFIQEECQGKLEEVFNHLRYDKDEGVLYLVGNQVELGDVVGRDRAGTYHWKEIDREQKEKEGQQYQVLNQQVEEEAESPKKHQKQQHPHQHNNNVPQSNTQTNPINSPDHPQSNPISQQLPPKNHNPNPQQNEHNLANPEIS